MTDKKEETKKVKKLTLGGSKLSLGNRPSFGKKITKSTGNSVVVEVKQGRASSGSLKLNRSGLTSARSTTGDDERMELLKKAQESNAKQSSVSTLSKLAELNQDKINKIKEIEEEKRLQKVTEEARQSAKEQLEESSSPAKLKDNSQDTKSKVESESKQNKPDDAKAKSKRSEIGQAVVYKKESKPKIGAEKKPSDKKPSEEKEAAVKPKTSEPKKMKKADIFNMMDDSGNIRERTRSLASLKRARAKERRKNEAPVKVEKVYREVTLPEVITVAELASRMTERAADVTRELMKLGVMATSNQSIDADTAELIIEGFGHSVKRVKDSDIENVLIDKNDNPEHAVARAPIVTVMGHVDHGKTSLLDALKSTDVAADEAGGITQHIGAYSVTMSDDRMITFIDTPGHEAFTEMRTRGAKATDIVVLVVAADDGIKAQTIEAISHAKAADVPIIVAINKIDKPGADIEKVKNELLSYELVPEDLGGDVITVGVSAKQRTNLDKLEESILLIAEMQELKANPKAVAKGVVIESRVDSSKGVITTIIVQTGTLLKGDIIMAGTTHGRIKRMCNDKGRSIQEAGPSVAVEIYGLANAPMAGDVINVVESEKQARDIIDYRIKKQRDSQVTASKTSLEDLLLKASGNGKVKELPIIVKGDVQGSIEAIISSLEKIKSDEVKVRVLHSGVGAISESDISLANASGAIVIGFNVRSNNNAATQASNTKVDVRYYSIIYNLIDDIKAIMSGMLSPIIREEYIGSVEIREVFNITKVGKIAGSYVTKGTIMRGAGVRLLRDNIVIHEGSLKTLKRFKEDVKEVREGYECGIAFERYEDIKIGDNVEVFKVVEEQKKL